MQLNWGMIGAGAIAPAFATGVKTSQTGKLYAIASRDKARAEKLAGKFPADVIYTSYEQLLADPKVQAVYVCLPHTMHFQWVIAALEAGKHVLCEKPFAVTARQAAKMLEVARARRLMAMEAFMYRCHPQTAKLVEVLKSKVIGDIRIMQGSFSYHNAFDPKNRVHQNHMAGGAILELGGYPMSMSRLVAGVALGRPFAEPKDVVAVGSLQGDVDQSSTATLRFEGDIISQISACLTVNGDNAFRIFGSKGQIYLPGPYVSNRQDATQGKIIIQMEWQAPYEVEVPADRTSYAYEVDFFAQGVASGTHQPAYPAVSNDDTLGNMRALDAWRAGLGCVFAEDKA
jgi:predicted dehydrogenase